MFTYDPQDKIIYAIIYNLQVLCVIPIFWDAPKCRNSSNQRVNFGNLPPQKMQEKSTKATKKSWGASQFKFLKRILLHPRSLQRVFP